MDPSDVLQEVYLDAARQLAGYLEDPPLPFFLWLRQFVGTRLAKAHCHHLGALCRDAHRQVARVSGPVPEASSATIADQLLGPGGRTSEAAVRRELREQLLAALGQMDPLDREVLPGPPTRRGTAHNTG